MSWLSTEFYHYAGSAPCRAVHMCLKALNVDYDDKPIDIMKAENKRAWFLRLNRQQMVPVLSDQSFIMIESRAIMMYLCNKYCTDDNQFLYPLEPENRGKVDKYLFFDMGTFSHAITEYYKPLIYQGLPPEPEQENMLKQSLSYLDEFLEEGGTPYLCGETYTIADIAILASVTELDAMDYNYKCYGELNRYIERLKKELPYYEECCAKGIEMTRRRVKAMEEEHRKEVEKVERKKIPIKKT